MQIDAAMNSFRLASRELFNYHFHAQDPGNDEAWKAVERFREVEAILFQKLVSEPLSLKKVRYGESQLEISVALRKNMEMAPIMVNRDVDSGYWDHSLEKVPQHAKMAFISFFDWDQLSVRDNQFVRVQLLYWPAHAEVEGKHALIESQSIQFTKVEQS
jgi:hypothetical protein